jgi:hypothetical protein
VIRVAVITAALAAQPDPHLPDLVYGRCPNGYHLVWVPGLAGSGHCGRVLGADDLRWAYVGVDGAELVVPAIAVRRMTAGK